MPDLVHISGHSFNLFFFYILLFLNVGKLTKEHKKKVANCVWTN